MQRLSGRGILVAADAEKELLAGVLRYRPWLVKPNSLELGDLYGVTLRTKEDVIHYARKLQEEGAQILTLPARDASLDIYRKKRADAVLRAPALFFYAICCSRFRAVTSSARSLHIFRKSHSFPGHSST